MAPTNDDSTKSEHKVPRRPLALWQNRDYLLLWSGQTISSIGSGVSELAFPLLVLAFTHSPAQAGFAGALRMLPYFIFTLPGGALIDRWDRKRVMILCDAGRALSLASIPVALFLGHLTIVQLYLVSLIEGSLYVFFDLAETASLPRVVPTEQLPAAISQNQVTFGITTLLGPPLGGVLYTVGRAVPFLTDAVSYLASVLSLLFIQTKFQMERVVAPRRLWTEMVEGMKWLWHQPLLRAMAFLNSGWSSLRLISYSLRPVGVALTGVLMQFIGVVPTAMVFSMALVLLALGASLNAHIRKALPLAQVGTE